MADKKKTTKKKRKRLDQYGIWERDGVLKDNLFIMQGMTRNGASDTAIAEYLGIDRHTLIKLKTKYEDVNKMLRQTKDLICFDAENSLIKKMRDGDLGAIKFYLTNMKPEQWKNNADFKVHNTHEISFVIDDLTEVFEDDDEIPEE